MHVIGSEKRGFYDDDDDDAVRMREPRIYNQPRERQKFTKIDDYITKAYICAEMSTRRALNKFGIVITFRSQNNHFKRLFFLYKVSVNRRRRGRGRRRRRKEKKEEDRSKKEEEGEEEEGKEEEEVSRHGVTFRSIWPSLFH